MKKQKRGRGRPRKSITELIKKRDAVQAELDDFRKTPFHKRSEKQKKLIISRASQVVKLNYRIENGVWT